MLSLKIPIVKGLAGRTKASATFQAGGNTAYPLSEYVI